MATKSIAWNTGSGNINVEYGGSKDGTIVVTSDNNNLYESRSQQIKVKTTDGSNIERTITIQQAAKVRTNISTASVTASEQTYSGSAKTPTVTVTLNGSVIPSSGYDVAYSNNTNAGTATITITGKGDYIGTATGSFIINKASRTISFADAYVVLNTSSNVTKTATPSAGSGDGTITYSISSTTYATINSSSGKVTAKTSDGSAIVTATIAEGTNYLSATESYNLYVFATTHNYDYNGSYRNVTLPPGTYQFQCWGAQGGSNAADSSYGITAKAGGKGGYSVGQLTVSEATGVRVYVGGQGSSSAGGFNGGGSTSSSSSYSTGTSGQVGYLYGTSRMGGGGGATDIRLSDGALLSRMIVAGGGSGGAMGYRSEVVETVTWTTLATIDLSTANYTEYQFGKVFDGYTFAFLPLTSNVSLYVPNYSPDNWMQLSDNEIIRAVCSSSVEQITIGARKSDNMPDGSNCVSTVYGTTTPEYTVYKSSTSVGLLIFVKGPSFKGTITIQKKSVSPTTEESTVSQVGFVGGGTQGAGYGTSYPGKQNAAGAHGSFGQGANQTITNYRYCSAAGGGGWYGGGGGEYINTDMEAIKLSGGGSGWVNTAASAGNRPSGYTGLQLDSGSTIDGNTSFPSTSGGTETGHSGDGYARITRIS